MRIVKCRNLGDVSLSSDEQQLLFDVVSKEIAADITVAGTMTRIVFTSINEVDALPAVETATDKALYKTATAVHTKLRGEWVQLALISDIDKAVTVAKAELIAITTGLETAVSDLATADTELSDRLTTVESDLNTANTTITSVNSRLAYNGEKTIEELFALVYEKDSELNSEIAQNKTDIASVKSVNDTQSTDIETLKNRVSTLEGSIKDDTGVDLSGVTSRLAALEASDGGQNQQLAELSEDIVLLTEAVTDKVTTTQLNASLQDKVDADAVYTKSETNELLTELENKISADGSSEQLESLEARVGTLEESASGVQDSVSGVQDTATDAQNRVAAIENKAASTEMRFMDIEGDVSDLKTSVSELSGSVSSLNEQVMDLSEVPDRLIQSDATQNTKLTDLESRLQALEALNAVGITFGVITAGGYFQAVDLAGDTPVNVGEPVEASIYTYHTPEQES